MSIIFNSDETIVRTDFGKSRFVCVILNGIFYYVIGAIDGSGHGRHMTYIGYNAIVWRKYIIILRSQSKLFYYFIPSYLCNVAGTAWRTRYDLFDTPNDFLLFVFISSYFCQSHLFYIKFTAFLCRMYSPRDAYKSIDRIYPRSYLRVLRFSKPS